MGRASIALLAILSAVGSWLMVSRSQSLHVDSPVAWLTQGTRERVAEALSLRNREAIRIATVDLNRFSHADLHDQPRVRLWATVFRQFDVIALQNVDPIESHVIPALSDMARNTGRDFGYLMSEPTGRGEEQARFGFLFDRDRVTAIPQGIYTVQDPDDLLTQDPYVAAFRVLHVPAEEAFTFSLVNLSLSTSAVESDRETRMLGVLQQSVVNDGRGEDDVILLGNFRAGPTQFASCLPAASSQWALMAQPTEVGSDAPGMNLVFGRQATVEFTGRSGTIDLVREFNFSTEEARRVSPFFPVWAEFSLREGGR